MVSSLFVYLTADDFCHGLADLQVETVSAMLVARLLPPLLIAAAALVAAAHLKWPAPSVLLAAGPALLCAAAPLGPTALQHAHIFRLNENLVAALARVSTLTSILLLPVLGIATTAGVALSSTAPLLMAIGAAAVAVVAVWVGAALKTDASGTPKVKMVYKGVPKMATKTPEPPSAAPGPVAQGKNGSSMPVESQEGVSVADGVDPTTLPEPSKRGFTDIDGIEGSDGGGASAARSVRPRRQGLHGVLAPSTGWGARLNRRMLPRINVVNRMGTTYRHPGLSLRL